MIFSLLIIIITTVFFFFFYVRPYRRFVVSPFDFVHKHAVCFGDRMDFFPVTIVHRDSGVDSVVQKLNIVR